MNFKKEGKAWWRGLESQWKKALNETLFNKGAVETTPNPAELQSLQGLPVLRIAGPKAPYPNCSVELTNLSGVAAFKDLTLLSVAYCQLESIQEVKGLPLLQHLFLNDNRITSLKGVGKLTKLKEIYFQNNQVESLRPLRRLTQLEVVYAPYNRLSNFEGIGEQHAENMRQFTPLPNENIRDHHVIRFQNSAGIICRKG